MVNLAALLSKLTSTRLSCVGAPTKQVDARLLPPLSSFVSPFTAMLTPCLTECAVRRHGDDVETEMDRVELLLRKFLVAGNVLVQEQDALQQQLLVAGTRLDDLELSFQLSVELVSLSVGYVLDGEDDSVERVPDLAEGGHEEGPVGLGLHLSSRISSSLAVSWDRICSWPFLMHFVGVGW